MKKDKIYQQIKQNIISGVFKEGDKLPTEFECMDIYNVSRDTVRGAFKLLENDGFIKRVKSKGTFIRLPEVSHDNKNIYLLVSCYEHLQYASGHSLQIMFDLIAECALVGWNLVPIVFSQTNSPTDIWWENLARFNSDSRIVVPRLWFSNYFKTLSALKAKVAFINNDSELPDNLKQYTCHWGNFIENDSYAGREAAQFLIEKKCKKIALIMEGANDRFNTLRHGYIENVKRSQIEYCELYLSKNYDLQEVKDFYTEKKFDGLLLHINEYILPHKNSLRTALNLPPEMPIVIVPNKSPDFYDGRDENITIVEYKIREMCHDIVSYLTAQQNKNEQHEYNTSLRCSKIKKQ